MKCNNFKKKSVLFSLFIFVVISVSANSETQTEQKRNIISLVSKETITPIELNHGDIVSYTKNDGETLTIELLSTSANILFTNKDKIPPDESGNDRGNMYRARLLYEITADVLVNNCPMTMRKYVGSQESFCEPYVINGVRIWFDAVSDLFEVDGGFLNLARGGAGLIVDGKPNKKSRFVFHDMTKRICPGEIHPWFIDGNERDENFIYKDNFIDVGRTYNGDDCYLGAYMGGECHSALDVVMAMNSSIYAPFDLDTQKGIRASGTKTWPDGSIWSINTGHIVEKYVPDNTPVNGGVPYGRGARRAIGWHPHAHFGFRIIEKDVSYIIDPWIIFWQHFEDNKKRDGWLRAMIEPFPHSKTGSIVNFNGVCNLNDAQCKYINYYWTFGDGGWSDLQTPKHIYSNPGIYPVTLTVSNGQQLASFTQHITVEGEKISKPVLILTSEDEPSFRLRPKDAMDVYGWPIKFIPHTFEFLSRPSRPEPNAKIIQVKNFGEGKLSTGACGLDYKKGFGWLDVEFKGEGNNQNVEIKANGKGLSSGKYEAVVSIHCQGALNSPQKFRVIMNIPEQPAHSIGVIIDDKDTGFYCTPYFWIGHRFHGWGWPELKNAEGYNNFYLINGQKAFKGEFARFTPDLESGTYEIWLYEKTPYASGPPANNEPSRFQTRVVHADGEDIVWMEPKKMEGFYPRTFRGPESWAWLEPQPSRKIGEFRFEEGMDGFVEILAEGSTGQVIVDAVRFLKKNY